MNIRNPENQENTGLPEQDDPEEWPENREYSSREEAEDDEPAVEWDGSEAELVADEVAEYEDAQTGVKLSYVLRQKEIFEALKKTGYSKTTGKRAIFEILVLALLLALFLVSYFMNRNNNDLVFSVICAVLIVIVAVFPWMGLQNRSKQLADGSVIHMEIYPDAIVMGEGASQWEIPLDGSCQRQEESGLIILHVRKTQMVVLPLRCIEPAVLPEVQAMVVAGTEKAGRE